MYKTNYLRQKVQNGQADCQATNNNVAKEKEKERGITLIALVISIIVLLILARSKYFGNNRKRKCNEQSKGSKRTE